MVFRRLNESWPAACACVAVTLMCSSPVFAGGYGVSPGAPLGPIAPGFSQNCIDKLEPKLTGAAANRAVRACRRPTGPQAGDRSTAGAVKTAASESSKP